MDSYLDISLKPDPEFAPTVLMNALFAKLHRALVADGRGRIGLSFPDVLPERPALGSRLRLHGAKADLAGLMALSWLQGMRDHVQVGAMARVPQATPHRVVRRVQAQSSPERLRRRLAKRRGLSLDEARGVIPESAAQRLCLPFLTLRSGSSGHQFRLFIEHGPLQSGAMSGQFSHYGLSPTATVPWF